MKNDVHKNSKSIPDPFAPVRLSPVSVNGNSVTNVGVEIRTDDRWKSIAIHSSSYQLIPNFVARETGAEILRKSGMDWRQVRSIWTGRFLSLQYCSDRLVEIPEVGDSVCLGLRLENSYDGSSRLRIVLMAFVLSCENGLMSPRHFTSYNIKHVNAELFDTDAAVSTLVTGFDLLERIRPRIEELSKTPLSIDTISQAVSRLPLPARDWPDIIKSLHSGCSVWDFLQAITHRVTHHGRGKAQLGNGEAVGDYFLSDFQIA